MNFRFLGSRVTQKALQLPLYCFLFLLPAGVLKMARQKFSLPTFHHSLPESVRTKIKLVSLDTLKNISLVIFLLYETRVTHDVR